VDVSVAFTGDRSPAPARMFLRAQIDTGQIDALTVPRAAVIPDGD